jgi:hypothetical protein
MSADPHANESDGYSEPVLAFDTDEPEFARGFEAGRVSETRLARELGIHRSTFHHLKKKAGD